MRSYLTPAAALALLAGQAGAQTYSYIGPAGGGWHNPNHWSPNGIPGVDPTGVSAAIGASTPVVMLTGATPQVQNLISASKLTIWTGVIISGNGAITDMDLVGTGTGGFSVGGELVLQGENTLWRSGVIAGTVKNQGTMTIGGSGGNSGYPTVDGLFRNDGTCTVGAQMRLQNQSTMENPGTMFVHATIGETAALGGMGGTLKNTGTLRVQPQKNGIINAPFESTGPIEIDTGSLTIDAHTAKLMGNIQLSNGGSLAVYQDTSNSPQPELGCAAGGTGNLHLAGGNMKVVQGMTVAFAPQSTQGFLVQLGAGALTLNETLTNSGRARLSSGRIQGLGSLVNSATGSMFWQSAVNAGYISNYGLITMESSPGFDGGELYNEAGGTIDLSTGGFSLPAGNTGKVFNYGKLVRELSSINAVTIAPALHVRSGSLIEVKKSMLSVNGGGNWQGTSTVKVGPQGGTLNLTNGITEVQSGEHTIQGEGGSVHVTSTGVLTVMGGQLINVLGTASSNDGLQVSGWLRSAVTQGVRNAGRMLVTGGILDGGISLGIHNVGVCEVTGGTIVGRVLNQGLLRFTTLQIGIAGSQGGELRNQGMVQHNAGNGLINLARADSYVRNHGELAKLNAGVLSVNGVGLFDNPGKVRANTGTIQINTPVQQLQAGRNGLRLVGGDWIVENGGKILLPTGQSVKEVQTGTTVRGNGLGTPWMKDVNRVSGTLEFDGDIMFANPMDLFFGAKMRIEEPANVTVPGGVENGGPEDILSEIEEVFVPAEGLDPMLTTPVLNNHARLVPGGHNLAGPFNLTGNLVSHPTARIIVELGGPDPQAEHDQVTITGSAHLDGTLELRLINSFAPAPNQEFIVLTATGGVSGVFDAVVLNGGPAGVGFEAVYDTHSVRVRALPGCYANCDGSTTPPVLNVADFSCFLQKFAAQDPYANCDGSTVAPVLNVADFGCFLQKFAGGCR